jgi:hypothetical protein
VNRKDSGCRSVRTFVQRGGGSAVRRLGRMHAPVACGSRRRAREEEVDEDDDHQTLDEGHGWIDRSLKTRITLGVVCLGTKQSSGFLRAAMAGAGLYTRRSAHAGWPVAV